MQEILSIFSKPSMLHAAVVHLPIVLLSMGVPLLILTALFHKNLTLRLITALIYICAAGSAFYAVETGEHANDHVPVTLPAAISDLKVDHMDLGIRVGYASAITAVLVLLSLLPLREVRTFFTLIALVAALYSAGLVAYTAHLGGELVYEHGLGTPHMESYTPKPAPAPDASGSTPAPAPAPNPDLVGILPIDPAQAALVSYTRDIKPIMEDRCLDCHEGAEGDGGYDVSSVAGILKAGEKGGPGVVPGKPDESSIVQYIRGEKQPRMPKKKKPLSVDDLHLIRQWIAAGAQDDSAAPADAAPVEEPAPAPEPVPAPEPAPVPEPVPTPEPVPAPESPTAAPAEPATAPAMTAELPVDAPAEAPAQQ